MAACMETNGASHPNHKLGVLMSKYLGGDDRAFRELHEHLNPRIRRQIRRKVSDIGAVEDLLQLTFLKAHAARARFVAQPTQLDTRETSSHRGPAKALAASPPAFAGGLLGQGGPRRPTPSPTAQRLGTLEPKGSSASGTQRHGATSPATRQSTGARDAGRDDFDAKPPEDRMRTGPHEFSLPSETAKLEPETTAEPEPAVRVKAREPANRFDQPRPQSTATGDDLSDRCVAVWYSTIARNATVDYLRKRGRDKVVCWDDPTDEYRGIAALRDPRAEFEGRAVREEERNQRAHDVRKAVGKLPRLQREVVQMHRFDGLSMAEIAERTQVHEGTLRVRAHRAYRSLATRLGDRR